jgi:hypothetical protein
MSRLSRRREARRSGWKTMGTAADAQRIFEPVPLSRQMVVPDSSKRLSDGLVIETSIVARLLGVKLLTLNGTVFASPGHLRHPGIPSHDPSSHGTSANPGPLGDRQQSTHQHNVLVPPPRLGGRTSSATRFDGTHGSGLESAARLIRESDLELRALPGADAYREPSPPPDEG